MRVSKIQNPETIVEDIKKIDYTNNIYLIEQDASFDNFIKQLEKELERNKYKTDIMYRIKITKDYKLITEGKLKIKSINRTENVSSIYNLLLTYENSNMIPSENDDLIINSKDYKDISIIIQRLILDLKLPIRIYNERDYELMKNVEYFEHVIDIIENKTMTALQDIDSLNIESENVWNKKKNIITYLQNIKTYAEMFKKNSIKICIFGSKKSGKSMVINGLLGKEFAPTSQELPTPNSITYIPHDKTSILLEYAGITKEFQSAEDVKEYILGEFENVKIKGKKISEMHVYYPRNTASFTNYIVVDTPGPDLAGSDHKEETLEKISEADVSVFVMDYSKHLIDSENEWLQKIKTEVEHKEKFYSFILLLNKIDLIHIDPDTEKLLNRISDYIRVKLNELGYNDFVIIPATAMIYFYTKKIMDSYPDITNSENNLIDSLKTIKKELRKKDSDDTLLTYITETENFLNRLENLLLYDNDSGVRLCDLMDNIGFILFEKYLKYINEHVLREKKYQNFYEISKLSVIINNILCESKTLNQNVEDIEKLLSEFEKIKPSLKVNVGELKLEEKFQETINTAVETICSSISSHAEQKVRNILEEIQSFTGFSKTKEIFRGIKDVGKNIIKDLADIKKTLENTFTDIEAIINSAIIEIQDQISKNIKTSIENINTSLGKSYSINFTVPHILPYVSFESLEKSLIKIGNNIGIDLNDHIDMYADSEQFRKLVSEGDISASIKKDGLKAAGNKMLDYIEEDITDKIRKKTTAKLTKFRTLLEKEIQDVITTINESVEEGLIANMKTIEDDVKLDKDEKEKITSFLSNVEDLVKDIINLSLNKTTA